MQTPRNKISIARQQEITSIVDSVMIDTGMSYPEYSLKKIIQQAIPGVLIKESVFDGNRHIKGAVFRESPEYSHPIIAIQSNQPNRAKAFALAHEFGHYILKHNPDRNYLLDTRNFDGSNVMQDEGEANFFAMVLLMPKDKFLRLDQPFVNDTQLAEYFGVTEPNVKVRREWLRTNGY